MSKYPRTASTAWGKMFRTAAALALLTAVFASAQNGRPATRTNSAGATLRITALIVPAVLALPRTNTSTQQSAISYYVPAPQIPLRVTEQIRPWQTETAVSAMLKTVTVMPE